MQEVIPPKLGIDDHQKTSLETRLLEINKQKVSSFLRWGMNWRIGEGVRLRTEGNQVD